MENSDWVGVIAFTNDITLISGSTDGMVELSVIGTTPDIQIPRDPHVAQLLQCQTTASQKMHLVNVLASTVIKYGMCVVSYTP